MVSPPLRHSTRIKNPPLWLSDFITNQILTSIPSNLPIHAIYDAHINFLANLSNIQEPHIYNEASKSPHWVQAMQDELQALEQNQTWELTVLPKGKKKTHWFKMGVQGKT